MKEWESTEPELTSLHSWSEVLAEVQARIAPRFARAEVRERAGRYLVGLIDRVERKNGWQLAEALGEQGPQGVQRLRSAAVWDAEGVRDDLRRFVVEALGDEASGVLIVDETGYTPRADTPVESLGSTPARRARKASRRSGCSWPTPRRRGRRS